MDRAEIESLHWGESDRNVAERTGGRRNDSALAAVADELAGIYPTTTFFLQLCGHVAARPNPARRRDPDAPKWVADVCPEGSSENCREVTAIFRGIPWGSELPGEELQGLRKIANRLRVPLYVFEHHPLDWEKELPVRVHRYRYRQRRALAGESWDDALDLLREEQLSHEAREHEHPDGHGRHHPRCGSDGLAWIPGTVAALSEHADLTLSSAIREIPAVRHLDLDLVLICPECSEPFCIVEATSDGYGARSSVEKASTMTRRVASEFGARSMLVRHAIDDADLSSSVSTTLFRWNRGDREKIERSEEGDWDLVFDQIDLTRHRHEIERHRGR